MTRLRALMRYATAFRLRLLQLGGLAVIVGGVAEFSGALAFIIGGILIIIVAETWDGGA